METKPIEELKTESVVAIPVDWNLPLEMLDGTRITHFGTPLDSGYRKAYFTVEGEEDYRWYAPEGLFESEKDNPTYHRHLRNVSLDVVPQFDLNALLALHREICEHSREIMHEKNHDYTNGSDSVFANFEGSEFLGVHPVIGILLRTMDKFKRIETFVTQGKLKVKGESVTDAISDSINYLVLALGMIRQEAADNTQES